MSNFIVPNIFVPGTKAKAQEVNENFSEVKKELDKKVEIGGDKNKTFAVAVATEGIHAVNKSQTEDLLAILKCELMSNIANSSRYHIFAINGNVDSNGNADIIDVSGLSMYFKVGNGYDNLEIFINDAIFELTQIDSFDLTGYADGDYNVFVDVDGNVSVLNNTIYVQPKQPDLLINDVWVNTSKSPVLIKQSIGSGLEDFDKILLGKIRIEESSVTEVKSCAFNSKFVTGVCDKYPAEVIQTYIDGQSWYRVYSDGWCEQGGYSNGQGETVYFLKPFKNTDYTLTLGICGGSSGSVAVYAYIGWNAKYADSFFGTSGPDGAAYHWEAKGYIW